MIFHSLKDPILKIMKKVLTILPYKLDEGAQAQSIDYVYQTYLKKLISMGILPILCSSLFSKEMITEFYKQADGILLLGGGDISPDLYNHDHHEKTKAVNPLRDNAESIVVNLAMKDKKPILGICRGMQLVNCVLGGSLHQHLPHVVENEEHWVVSQSGGDPSYDDVASDRDQFMIVQESTKLADIVGAGKKLVHCAHHQSIDSVASQLAVNAKSETGVIEGLELIDPGHFVMLLQNHIETQDNEFSKAIWNKFAEAL